MGRRRVNATGPGPEGPTPNQQQLKGSVEMYRNHLIDSTSLIRAMRIGEAAKGKPTLWQRLKAFLRCESGSSAIEQALLAVLVSLFSIWILFQVGGALAELFHRLAALAGMATE